MASLLTCTSKLEEYFFTKEKYLMSQKQYVLLERNRKGVFYLEYLRSMALLVYFMGIAVNFHFPLTQTKQLKK